MTTTTERLTIPTSQHIQTQLGSEGIEFTTVLPDYEVPEGLSNARYMTPLHQDGSICDCGCIRAEQRTTIPFDQVTTVGDWQWFGDRVALVGWHRTGPSPAEVKLAERIDELGEDVAEQRILREMVQEGLEGEIAALEGKRGRLRASLRRARRDAAEAESRWNLAYQVAFLGWGAAVLVALLWIDAVIA